MTTDLYCEDAEVIQAIFSTAKEPTDQETRAVQTVMTAACRQLDTFCDRPDGFSISVTQTRLYVPLSDQMVLTDDIASSTVVVKTDENGDGVCELQWLPTDFQLEPVNAPFKHEGRPYNMIRAIFTKIFPLDYGAGSFLYAGGKRLVTPDSGPPIGAHHTANVSVTARFGYPAVPAQIHDAAIQQSIYLYKSFGSAFGIAGAGDVGEVRMLGDRLHPTARSLAWDFRRDAGGLS